MLMGACWWSGVMLTMPWMSVSRSSISRKSSYARMPAAGRPCFRYHVSITDLATSRPALVALSPSPHVGASRNRRTVLRVPSGLQST